MNAGSISQNYGGYITAQVRSNPNDESTYVLKKMVKRFVQAKHIQEGHGELMLEFYFIKPPSQKSLFLAVGMHGVTKVMNKSTPIPQHKYIFFNICGVCINL